MDGREKSFEFAQETTKQQITLATAILALTITFLKDIAQAAPDWSLYVLAVGWFFYLVSVIFGIFTLMTLTGAAASEGTSVNESSLQSMAQIQFLAFVGGIVLTITFGVAAVFKLA